MSSRISESDDGLAPAVVMATALSTAATAMWRHYCTVQTHEPLMAMRRSHDESHDESHDGGASSVQVVGLQQEGDMEGKTL